MKNVLNKLIVVGAVVLLLGVSGVWAVQKFGTDPTTSISYGIDRGYISTSKDTKLFAATGAGLQQAVYYLNGSGGAIYLPAMNISVSKTITKTSQNPITIIGSGWQNNGSYGGTCLKDNGAGIIMTIGTASEVITGVTIENVCFSASGYDDTGLYLLRNTQTTLRNVWFAGFNRALHIKGCWESSFYNLRVLHCGNIVDTTPAVVVEQYDATVDGQTNNLVFNGVSGGACHYGFINIGNNTDNVYRVSLTDFYLEPSNETGTYGIRLDTNGQGFSIDNPQILYGSPAIDITTAGYCSITGGEIYSPRSGGINMTTATNVNIVGTVFSGGENSYVLYMTGSSYITVQGCSFTYCKKGVNIVSSNYVVVNGNTFREVGSGYNLDIQNNGYHQISNNVFEPKNGKNAVPAAIVYLWNQQNTSFIGNVLYQNPTYNTVTYGVYVPASSDFNLFALNKVEGDITNAFSIADPHSVIFNNDKLGVWNNTFMVIPLKNTTSPFPPGFMWYNVIDHKLWIYEGATGWKSEEFT